ncbi:MAG: uracil-DNA glycosylase [archaeon]|nr:uracil-DNA glycosylase [Nanoarchaeota archaeon]
MAKNLYDLAEGIRKCTACPLHKKRMLAVPGEGTVSAKLFFVGEAPGSEEDRQGLPFVGRSGKFLDEMFNLVGIKREEVFITGSVKCHPENNRNPKAGELKTCKKLWLDTQIEIVKPEIIVLLGRVALQNFLGNKYKLDLDHGKIIGVDFNSSGKKQKFFLIYHPSAGRRFPEIRKKIQADFKKMIKLSL